MCQFHFIFNYITLKNEFYLKKQNKTLGKKAREAVWK